MTPLPPFPLHYQASSMFLAAHTSLPIFTKLLFKQHIGIIYVSTLTDYYTKHNPKFLSRTNDNFKCKAVSGNYFDFQFLTYGLLTYYRSQWTSMLYTQAIQHAYAMSNDMWPTGKPYGE
jgi:hypothetical protein